MLPTNHAADRDFCRALAFESASAALAAELLAGTDSCTEADAGYEAMQQAVTHAFRTAARQWNRAHDRLTALPTELRTMCWSYLPSSALLRLASVCRSWRGLSRNTPLLWTELKISSQRTDLLDLFSLSAGLPLAIDLRDCSLPDMRRVNRYLCAHAAHLKGLSLSFTDERRIFEPDVARLFSYTAPSLQSFSLRTNRDEWSLSQDLFHSHAPHLRSVTLANAILPDSCAAFANLTYLELEKDCGSLQHIYSLAPLLETLVLVDACHLKTLPAVPSSSKLTSATFCLHTLPFANLISRGYFGLPQLSVSIPYTLAMISSAARECPASFRGTLSLSDQGRTALTLRDEKTGRSASFVTTDAEPQDIGALLVQSSTFHTLEHLVLPAELELSYLNPPINSLGYYYPYIPAAGLELPALRRLTVLCAPQATCSLWNESCVSGRVKAPLLALLEFTLDPDTEALPAGDEVDPCGILLLMKQRIECNAPDKLEVRIDCAGGVRVGCRHLRSGEEGEDAFDHLRASIGKLVKW